MKELFMQIVSNITAHGNITAASLQRDCKYSFVEIETEDAVYTISVVKEEKPKEEKESK